jgi:hypothetical protein
MMYHAHPAIEGLHALRDSLGVIVRNRIPIGRDGRNRPSLFPFGTATGRNAQAKSLFNAHASMRSFMMFSPDKIGLYLDWRTQEVGIAAARSGDATLAEAYRSGDVYHALALMCGLNQDAGSWKPPTSKRQPANKALQPASIMDGRALAVAGSDRHPRSAARSSCAPAQISDLLGWRADTVERAMLERVILSEYDGWPMHISTSPNKRTLYNFQCRAAAPRCCGWRPTGCATPAGAACWFRRHSAWLDNEEQVSTRSRSCGLPAPRFATAWRSASMNQKLIGEKRYDNGGSPAHVVGRWAYCRVGSNPGSGGEMRHAG